MNEFLCIIWYLIIISVFWLMNMEAEGDFCDLKVLVVIL